MRKRVLWRVSVRTTQEAGDAVAELLRADFGQPASVYTDSETGAANVSVFLASPPAGPAWRSRLRAAIDWLRQCGLRPGPTKVSLSRLAPQDWAESWKRHFKPIEIGARLLILPSWSKRRARKSQAVVVLDPGLSFGTGQHPTTWFCLCQLVACRRPEVSQSILDAGTGSGLLAIAAARLGYAPIEALDLDPEALSVARRNATRNRVLPRIRFLRRDLSDLSPQSARKFSVICANLNFDLLIEHKQKLLGRLKADGVLALAGILRAEFPTIQRAYEGAGLQLINSRAQGEWRSGTFRAM